MPSVMKELRLYISLLSNLVTIIESTLGDEHGFFGRCYIMGHTATGPQPSKKQTLFDVLKDFFIDRVA